MRWKWPPKTSKIGKRPVALNRGNTVFDSNLLKAKALKPKFSIPIHEELYKIIMDIVTDNFTITTTDALSSFGDRMKKFRDYQ